ncbi:MAG TPA: hypothetical protein VMM13_06115 [Euzebya sp.]|nr:hypothetical protein [Euzebya sp.]
MRTTTTVLGLALLFTTACSAPPDPAMAERMANIEGRVADLEAAGTQAGQDAATDPGDDDAAEPGGGDALSEKEMFAAQVAEEDLGAQLQAEVADAEISDLRFDDATETLVVSARAGGTDLDGAWQMAQALARLWEDLDQFQPVLDLKVGDVRCACSSRLMKDVLAGAADRSAWEGACQEA